MGLALDKCHAVTTRSLENSSPWHFISALTLHLRQRQNFALCWEGAQRRQRAELDARVHLTFICVSVLNMVLELKRLQRSPTLCFLLIYDLGQLGTPLDLSFLICKSETVMVLPQKVRRIKCGMSVS